MLPQGWADLPDGWRSKCDPHDESHAHYWRMWHHERAEAIGCVYDEVAADTRVAFFAALKLVKGKWGGQSFVLLPHAEHQIVRPFFGYKVIGSEPSPNRAEIDPLGRRRFRRVDHWVAKKNAKTTLGGGLTAEALVLEREPGVEVYAASTDRHAASLVWQSAEPMIASQPTLSKMTKTIESQKRIVIPSLNGFFQVLSAESYSKHGLQPFAVLADELHAWPDPELWHVLTKGAFASRDEWILYVMSTAGFNMQGIGYSEFEKALGVRDGTIEDDRLLPAMHFVPQDADWKDEANWYKANPALGFPGCGWPYALDIDDMRAEFADALRNSADEYIFRVLRLCTWMSSTTRWLHPDDIVACVQPVQPLSGQHTGGLDLSSTTDLTAYVRAVWNGGVLEAHGHYFMPEASIQEAERRDKVPYRKWVADGWITATEGNIVDYAYVREYVSDCADRDGRPASIGFDPWNATQLCQVELPSDGFEMVMVRQGFATLSDPTKRLQALIVDGKLRIGDDPVMRWALSNVVVEMDPAGGIKASKSKSPHRIDPVAALINAIDRANRTPVMRESVYETRGILTLG